MGKESEKSLRPSLAWLIALIVAVAPIAFADHTSDPDFVTIASGYQVRGRHVWHLDELEEAVREMLDSDEAFLLDVHVEYQQHVLPMIPSGGNYQTIMTE